MMSPNRVFLTGIMLSFCLISGAQSVFGKWKTIDDRTGQPKAVIHVYQEDGLMHGEVETILEKGMEDAICDNCEGERKNKPIIGMKIIDGLKKNDDGEWKGKTLFDPQQAMTFHCKIWLNPDNPDELMVRGYMAFLYRTQTWLRVKG